MQIQSIVILIVCYFAICTGNIYAQRSSYAGSATATLPSVTDSRIVNFNQSHLSWLPASSPRNQLLVFLPGTGGNHEQTFLSQRLRFLFGVSRHFTHVSR